MFLRTLATTLLLAPAALAQASFQPGDLFLYNPAFQGPSSSSGAIARIDPSTGQVSVFLDLVTSSSGNQQLAYDSWRDQLIFFGGFVPNENRVWLADAAGNLTDLGLAVSSGPTLGNFSPRGDGIVYFRGHNAPLQISYFDAANTVQTLLDASGTAPYAFPPGANTIVRMAYDAPTNSLVVAITNNLGICPGGSNQAVNLWRIDLSPDGTRALSESCTQYDLNPGQFSGVPVGLATGLQGDLILHVDDNVGGLLPRMARIDVATLTVTPFASSLFGPTSAGCYSQTLGKAVVFDSFADELRAFSEGQAGVGSTIATGVSTPGGLGVKATLIEVQPSGAPFGLSASPSTLSLASGGTQAFGLDLGAALAGQLHLVLGSTSGTSPAFPVDGVPLPLALDAYTSFTLTAAGSATLPGSFGVLDAEGRAQAALVLAPGLTPSLAGQVLHHAALVLSPSGAAELATNPVALSLVL